MKRFLDYDGLREFKTRYDAYIAGIYATKEEIGSRTSFAYYDTLPILPSADVADSDFDDGDAKATLPDSSQIALKDLASLIILIPTASSNDPTSDESSAIDIKDEYILIRTAPISRGAGYHHYEWEIVGSTRVDLAPYVLKNGGDGTQDVKVNILRVNPSTGTVTPGENATQITSTVLTTPLVNAGKIKLTGSTDKAVITDSRVQVTAATAGDSSDGGSLMLNGFIKTSAFRTETINRSSGIYLINVMDPSASASGSWVLAYTDELNNATNKGKIEAIPIDGDSSNDIASLFR